MPRVEPYRLLMPATCALFVLIGGAMLVGGILDQDWIYVYTEPAVDLEDAPPEKVRFWVLVYGGSFAAIGLFFAVVHWATSRD